MYGGKLDGVYSQSIDCFWGKNSQILLFFKIISVLPLFKKYVAKYHFLELKFVKLEFDMKLEFIKIE